MFDVRAKFHNFELVPNGRTTEFVKRICCQHDWRVLDPADEATVVSDEDDVPVSHEACVDCGAECLRDPSSGDITQYDNSALLAELQKKEREKETSRARVR